MNMYATKTIPYDEYEGMINKQSTLLYEIESLRIKILELQDTIAFMKSDGDGVMVIDKVGGVTTHEYRSDTGNLCSMLVQENKTLVGMVLVLNSDIERLRNELNDSRRVNDNLALMITGMTSKIDDLMNTSVFHRIFSWSRKSRLL